MNIKTIKKLIVILSISLISFIFLVFGKYKLFMTFTFISLFNYLFYLVIKQKKFGVSKKEKRKEA
jgi:hypothetical protein